MTVYVNGRSLVHQGSGGFISAVSINLTPPNNIPFPYPSIAYTRHLTNTPDGVEVNGYRVATLHSYISHSRGDEAGSVGGIFSKTVNGRADFITYSPDTFINGSPVIRANDLAVCNQRNTPAVPIQQLSLVSEPFCFSIQKNGETDSESPTERFKWSCQLPPDIDFCHAYLGFFQAEKLIDMSALSGMEGHFAPSQSICIELAFVIPTATEAYHKILLKQSLSFPSTAEFFAWQVVYQSQPLHSAWLYMMRNDVLWRTIYCDEWGAYFENGQSLALTAIPLVKHVQHQIEKLTFLASTGRLSQSRLAFLTEHPHDPKWQIIDNEISILKDFIYEDN